MFRTEYLSKLSDIKCHWNGGKKFDKLHGRNNVPSILSKYGKQEIEEQTRTLSKIYNKV